mgnify:CR=1 FL=1
MTRGDIKQAIKDQVDDQSVSDSLLDEWVQAADDAVQTWRPLGDKDQTFDFWDYLKDEKTYETTADDNRFQLPDNCRAFVELRIGTDTQPYLLKDRRERDNYSDHICWIWGKYLYVKATPSESGQDVTLAFVHFSEAFETDDEEPEVESPYQQAHVAFGKSRYYNQQGDTELETQNMNEFERIMLRKKRDQEISRMTSANQTATVLRQHIV